MSDERIEAVAKVLRSGETAALLVGGRVVASQDGLTAAASVAGAADVKLFSETFPARLRRGAGIPAVERLGYLAEFAAMQLDGLRHLVIVDTVPPVSFFAYPDKASVLVPDGCEVHTLATGREDAVAALSHLADRLGARTDQVTAATGARPDAPTGSLNAETLAAAIGATLPEDAIIADEGNTSGIFLAGATATGPQHDVLTLTGGAIGFGMPVATGAAIAAPGRKVLNLQADGSAMYTLQALWTQAREQLDVVTVICNNRSYAILNMELGRVGAESGPRARRMLDLFPPDLDFVSLAKGMGITSTRATTADDLTTQLRTAMEEPGPHLIDAIVPSAF